jgi:hypothetical protein
LKKKNCKCECFGLSLNCILGNKCKNICTKSTNPFKLGSLKFKLINAHSLNNKGTLVIDYLKEYKNTIFCFTETWYKSKVSSENNSLLVGDSNFIVYRADRASSKRGGGVSVFIPKQFPFTARSVTPVKKVEYLAVDIFIGTFSFTLVVVYLPPVSSFKSVTEHCDTVRELCECLSTFLANAQEVLIAGDFNLPGINWQTFSSQNATENLFIDFLLSSDLRNKVLTPTRQDNILDLVISNVHEKIKDVTIEPPFATSDHNTVNFSLDCDVTLPQASIYSFKNFKRANYLAMNIYFLNYNWDFMGSNSQFDLESAYDEFIQVINNAILLFVDTVIPASSEKLPPPVKAMIAYRDNIIKTPDSLLLISKISKRILSRSIKAKRQREASIMKKFGIKGIFTHLGNFLKKDRHIPALKADNKTLFSDQDKVTALGKTFLTNFHPDKYVSEEDCLIKDNNLPFLTTLQVSDYLKGFKSKCNTSPDGIPYILLKKCAPTLAKHITKLINMSFMQGKVPTLWKQSHVIPIFKKGERHFPANYRPISLNCSLSAIPQNIVIDFLDKFFLEHNLIPECQHGFTKGKSVTTQLLESFDYITENAEKGIPIDIIFFDFKKAFDQLKHSKLFAKLKKANVPNSIIAWIQAFLTNRKFRVKIGEALSELFEANSGVPQGSKLGPKLFAFFIGDLIAFCKTPGVENELFADDLKALAALLSNTDSPLHEFLAKLETWTIENELEVAPHKCNVLHCLPQKNPKISYFFNGFKLPNNQSTIRDLGITVSDDLSWEPHITKIAKNATTRLFILFKALRSTSPKLLLHMYHTYVRPLVEFATPVFNPNLRKLVDKLEKVQRIAVRLIFARSKDLRPYSNAPYEEKLQRLGIESLETRRNKFDLTFLNDYISGNTNFKLNLVMRSSITRGAEKKLIIPLAKRPIRSNYFSVRASKRYVKLPRALQYTNPKTFRQQLSALKV